jgi:hypothetical protein
MNRKLIEETSIHVNLMCKVSILWKLTMKLLLYILIVNKGNVRKSNHLLVADKPHVHDKQHPGHCTPIPGYLKKEDGDQLSVCDLCYRKL